MAPLRQQRSQRSGGAAAGAKRPEMPGRAATGRPPRHFVWQARGPKAPGPPNAAAPPGALGSPAGLPSRYPFSPAFPCIVASAARPMRGAPAHSQTPSPFSPAFLKAGGVRGKAPQKRGPAKSPSLPKWFPGPPDRYPPPGEYSDAQRRSAPCPGGRYPRSCGPGGRNASRTGS